VASPDILDERMTGDDHPDAVVPLEAAHRSQSCLQPAVVALDPIVGVPVGSVPRRWQQLLQHHRIGRCSVGDDLGGRDLGRADGLAEEPAGGTGVPPRGDKYVDDLAELVDRSVHVPPAPSHLGGGLVHEPAVAHGVPAGTASLGQQRLEALHPAVDGDVVDLDAPFGEQFLDVAVGQAEAQLPADRQHDHLGRERKPAKAERGGIDWRER
jgi:hypothetical protein